MLTLIANQPEVGLGIVEVDIEATKEIRIFHNKGDNSPEKIIRLLRKNGDIAIEENDYTNWLRPETVWLDYFQFLFRYTKIEDGWIEVIINKETGEKKWILNSPMLTIKAWEQFLVENTTAIEPLESVDIKAEPGNGSQTIRKSSDEDCFEAIEIKGDWMKIKSNETLECSEHSEPIKAGWIRWRDRGRLTIRYYLTC